MKQAEKLAALRDVLKNQKVDGFLLPHSDEYQNEYLPAFAERLEWLTGFTGSAGNAVVLSDKAMVQSDSRYELQIVKQVDAGLYEIAKSEKITPGEWIVKNGRTGQVIGYDPKLHTPLQIRSVEKDLKDSGITLKPLPHNPLDAVWSDQPGLPMSPAQIFPEYVAGRSSRDKREDIAAKIVKEGAVASVLTLADSINWLLNIRGDDVPHTPLALSTAIVYADGQVTLFMQKGKIPEDVHAHFGNHVTVAEPAEFEDYLRKLGKLSADAKKPVMFDEGHSSIWCKQAIIAGGGTIKHMEDPCIQPKACKTPEEQDAMRNAHFRDGVAETKFLAWLDREGSEQTLTELDIAERLEGFRKLDPTYLDASFDTIAGWGANGAIVHYRATKESHATITPPGILLLDSGAIYTNGLTDITRTVAIGQPSDAMKKAFTLVLKGHIAIASAVMPEGTKGSDIDFLAREHLMKNGMNYGHGTGHGVGFRHVHEPGGGISSRAERPYKQGMIISNEPGYYQQGEFGIRIESLVMVQEAGVLSTGQKALKFETITVVPIDKQLINFDLMTHEEIDWLNEYHARVGRLLMPHMSSDEQAWLQEATSPLKKPDAAVDLGPWPFPKSPKGEFEEKAMPAKRARHKPYPFPTGPKP